MKINISNLSTQVESEAEDSSLVQARAKELEEKYLSPSLPLQRENASPKPFPFHALGGILGPVAKRIHEVIKAPDSICGQSVLAAAALITQAYADVHIDGRVCPLSLFLVTAAESGDRKSAVDNIVLKPIRDYEKMLYKGCIEEKQRYKNKLDAWKKQRELVMRSYESDILESELNKMDFEPPRPLEPYLLLEEPSYEGLIKLLAIGQPSVGLFSDEGGRMFGGYAMGKDNLLKTACGLSSLWDGGKPITRIRGGDENLLLYGRRFSSHLMIQEIVLANILKNELLIGQGFLARCLMVSPTSNAGNRPYNPVDISKDPTIQSFYSLVRKILDHPLPTDPEVLNELHPRPLYIAEDAKVRWISFHDEIDYGLKPEGSLYAIRRFANKGADYALRIAGVLTLIEDFEAATISLENMERAIELMHFYFDEALRIIDISLCDPLLGLAQKTLEWMKRKIDREGSRKTITLQEVYQGGPREVRNAKSAQEIMKILEEHGRVERLSQEKLEWKLRE
jgi:hypothetical protein